jgi:WhiB family redox-sensing transcriptional regulator
VMSDWFSRAACRGADTDHWFPSGDAIPAEVADICDGCPVRNPCLAYALADPELKGIWATTTEKERSRLRKARRKAS